MTGSESIESVLRILGHAREALQETSRFVRLVDLDYPTVVADDLSDAAGALLRASARLHGALETARHTERR